MASPVEEVKSRLSIVEVVGSYVKLEKAGSNFKARCPFHTEKTPSFFVSPTRGTFYCFGCGEKGDIFSFVEKFEGLDFPGALRVLASRAGVTLRHEDKEARGERERLYGLLDAAASFYESKLAENEPARSYLRGRGLSDETIRSFRLGFAPDLWRGARERLRLKGFTDAEIERAGLTKRNDAGGEPYDRFRSRIMFPLFDSSGRVIAFSGRIFGEAEKDAGGGPPPKYVNSPETPLFEKSKVLYGFDRAKFVIRKVNFAIVVEGQMDLLMSQQAGFTNTVALSGTALSERHLELLHRLSGNLVLALDADEAGVASAGKSALSALARGMDVKVARLPRGKDPAELIARDKEAWKEAIRTSTHIVDFLLAAVAEKGYDARTFGLKVRSSVLPYAAAMGNRIDQEHFVERIAGRLGVPADAVRDELKKTSVPLPRGEEEASVKNTPAPPLSRFGVIARRIAGLLFLEEGRPEPVFDTKSVRERFLRIAGEDAKRLLSAGGPLRDELLFEVEAAYGDAERVGREIEDMLDDLEEETLKASFSAALAELKRAEAEKRSEVPALLKRCGELSEALATLARRRESRYS